MRKLIDKLAVGLLLGTGLALPALAQNRIYFTNNKNPVVCAKVEFIGAGGSNFCLKQGESHNLAINNDAYACFCYVKANYHADACSLKPESSLTIKAGQTYRFSEDTFPTNCKR